MFCCYCVFLAFETIRARLFYLASLYDRDLAGVCECRADNSHCSSESACVYCALQESAYQIVNRHLLSRAETCKYNYLIIFKILNFQWSL